MWSVEYYVHGNYDAISKNHNILQFFKLIVYNAAFDGNIKYCLRKRFL